VIGIRCLDHRKGTFVPTGTIILLGAFAGLTIYLGLPIAFLKHVSQSLKAFLNMIATGVLIFLLYDVVSKATDPINSLISEFSAHGTGGPALFGDVFLFILGLGLGLVGLVYFNKYIVARLAPKRSEQSVEEIIAEPQPALVGGTDSQAATTGTTEATRSKPKPATIATPGEMPASTLALLIATGIGFHNFSEGLAIGQSAASGALQLAIVLIIGFGLHNMTEGFGIAGPITGQGQTVSWKFIAMLGLIGGGPTFLGTIVGIIFQSTPIFIFCLTLAAGAIIYVVAELLGVAKRYRMPEIVAWGLFLGFLLGYITDLIVTYAGA
jgi:ZIP family zinc transporter